METVAAKGGLTMAKQIQLTCTAGISRLRYTQVPDQILDNINAFSGPELAVLMYVTRHTLGYKKDEDAISLTQMVEGVRKRDGTFVDGGTGCSRSSVKRAVKSLEEREWLVVQRREWQSPREGRGPQRATSEYSLHFG